MATTLTYGGTTVTLPGDLLWTDEFGWPAVEQRTQYSITGALLLEAAVKQAGRTVTLTGGPSWGWITRSVLVTLQAWAELPAQQFTLVLRGEAARTVVFDQAQRPIEAQPVIDYSDPDSTDDYVATIRFLEV
jgi:hypothetical protein